MALLDRTLKTGGDERRRGGGPTSPADLPEELIGQAVERLQLLTLILACAWAAAIGLDILVAWASAVPVLRVGPAFGAVGIALSIGVHLIARWRLLPPRALLDLGLAYVVMIALVISIAEALTARVIFQEPFRHGISWVCVWLVLFPLLIPTTTFKMLFTAILCALAGPFAIAVVAVVVGDLPPRSNVYMQALVPNLISAGVAYLPSRIIHSLGSEIRRAERLGSYHLESLIGSGGMGEVWRGRHRLLARPAAIKLIRPEKLDRSDPAFARTLQARFEREAQATAALQSPHAISLYDFGVSADGIFYYAMELLDGLDLQELVHRYGPLPPERVVYLLAQACESLAEAHARGLIHRDIKPANLFVCRLGREVDFVKVLDFGLVRCLRERSRSDERTLTGDDQMPGTPAYVSPEMAAGDPVDHRADLYAIGCVAYFLLSGELVFEADTPVQVALKHLSAPPEPIGRRAAQPLPPALEALVMRLLSKRPSERPKDADELRDLFLGLELETPWTRQRAQAWWRDHLPLERPSVTPSTVGSSSAAAPVESPAGVGAGSPCGEVAR